MFWQDDDKKNEVYCSDKVIDLSYKINCQQILGSHAWVLAQALYKALPWLVDEPNIGIHQIHGATSGNGWERPSDKELIHLSKRTRMTLRVPKLRIKDSLKLEGQTLEIAGQKLSIGKASPKMITPLSTLFARYVVLPEQMSEADFLQWVANELKALDIEARKLLCGISHEFEADGKTIKTRSLMIADLDKSSSIKLQEQGQGLHRHLGCGIFVPHKGIKAVNESEDSAHFSGN